MGYLNYSYKETVDKIVDINKNINNFWSNAEGWAPVEAAELLSKSRLDWLTSLSYSLYKWEEDPPVESLEGDLILAWSNLGSLLEGTLKFFLSIFYEDYKKDINIIKSRSKDLEPDVVTLEQLKVFFYKSVWELNERKEKSDFIQRVQTKRNAIHAYKEREIADFTVFRIEVKNYLVFLYNIQERIPYPDDV